jgi:hypothetical protein
MSGLPFHFVSAKFVDARCGKKKTFGAKKMSRQINFSRQNFFFELWSFWVKLHFPSVSFNETALASLRA